MRSMLPLEGEPGLSAGRRRTTASRSGPTATSSRSGTTAGRGRSTTRRSGSTTRTPRRRRLASRGRARAPRSGGRRAGSPSRPSPTPRTAPASRRRSRRRWLRSRRGGGVGVPARMADRPAEEGGARFGQRVCARRGGCRERRARLGARLTFGTMRGRGGLWSGFGD
jgi:hypothetical protein